jgi:LAGLIDADG endonuclease
MTLKQLSSTDLAYIAGFLDGDGCINAQLVRRSDYILKFQIRYSLTFFQKTSRHWFLLKLQKQLGFGTVRKRPDGMSEYAVIGAASVKLLVQALLPYLVLKKNQATLVVQIIDTMSKSQDPQAFLKLCEMVDTIADLNDSKKRTLRASVVRSELGLDSDDIPCRDFNLPSN